MAVEVGNEWVVWDSRMMTSYGRHWDEWDAIRELVQNALDEAGTYNMERTPTGLAISDKGHGLATRHLFLGEGEKGDWMRGKFGKGLKIACLVLKRAGYDVKITSDGFEAIPFIGKSPVPLEPGEYVDTLQYRLRRIPPIVGTRIEIDGYTGSTYSERFDIGQKDYIIKE